MYNNYYENDKPPLLVRVSIIIITGVL